LEHQLKGGFSRGIMRSYQLTGAASDDVHGDLPEHEQRDLQDGHGNSQSFLEFIGCKIGHSRAPFSAPKDGSPYMTGNTGQICHRSESFFESS
jgi:hypothetical protein